MDGKKCSMTGKTFDFSQKLIVLLFAAGTINYCFMQNNQIVTCVDQHTNYKLVLELRRSLTSWSERCTFLNGAAKGLETDKSACIETIKEIELREKGSCKQLDNL